MNTFLKTPARRTNTNRNGAAFDAATINAVWNKASTVPGVSPNVRRMDLCGALIDRARYGETAEKGMGWEIDHIVPVSHGGSDDLSNLQPLQWQNNRSKGDKFPVVPAQFCTIKAT